MRERTNLHDRYNSSRQEPRTPNGEVSLNNRLIGNLGPMSQYKLRDSNGAKLHLQTPPWKGARLRRPTERP